MNIWLDLANSPQVLFFHPIVGALEAQGHQISITIRDFAQTRELADHHRLSYTAIGEHGGRSLRRTLTANFGRAHDLIRWARGRGFDLAVSSNVYSHVLACWVMRLPLVNLYDYDPNPANHIAFRLARRVIVPQAFPDASLRRYGARRYDKYEGVKEEVYLSDFEPTPDFPDTHGLPVDKVLVVMRPPSDWSPYHRFPNPLFECLLSYTAAQESASVIFLPRIPEQAEKVRKLGLSNVHVPSHAYYGPDLIFHADLVISAGGTMNREAAVLGIPVYTVYAGELGATDRYLIDLGRLTQIETGEDFKKISFEKRPNATPLARRELAGHIAKLIVA